MIVRGTTVCAICSAWGLLWAISLGAMGLKLVDADSGRILFRLPGWHKVLHIGIERVK